MQKKKVCTKCQIEKPLKDFYKDAFMKSGRRGECKICFGKYKKEYYQNNREKRLEYLKNNKEKIREQCKEYRKNNKEKINEYRKKYLEKYKTDIDFKLTSNLRSRIRKAIKNNYKTSSTIELLGCSIEKVKEHLESQFQEGMTWDNHTHDGWHIDHIKPCASFDLSDPEQQKECFHYTNLQPLWAKENLSKGAKINKEIKNEKE